MADMIGSTTSGTVSLTASTAKTALQLTAPSNRRVRVLGFAVYFDGTVSTNTPVAVRLLNQTSAGTMSTGTVVQARPVAETLQCTAQYNATSEPTNSGAYDDFFVHPQTGYAYRYPMGQELVIAGGGRFGIEVTAPQACDVRATIYWEE